MDLVNGSSIFTSSTAFITLLHPGKWPLSPALSFPFVNQLSACNRTFLQSCGNLLPWATFGIHPSSRPTEYMISTGSPLSTCFLTPFQNCSRTVGQDPRKHDNSFPAQKECSENILYYEVHHLTRFAGSSSPWAPPQSLGLLGITLAYHQLSDTMAVCKERLQTLSSSI